ncbi:unnamed protein product [Notodromas monacha]|uniref:Lambda-crystallin n=1 Tax=Notodromas monacha TaxID=399045 RepID=A0A7R9BSM6_9CRUS|nr:unnamed protein product [Notodromas monacha]CAG0919947.1 unnamed protein product [Notodromas monacha]
MSSKGKIGIMGSGLIGRSWAMLFASVGYPVQLFDVSDEQLKKALEDIANQMKSLEADGTLRGSLSAERQLSLISTSKSLEETVSDAWYVQECVPESLDVKKEAFKKLDDVVESLGIGNKVILASSSSTIASSLFSEGLKHKARVLIAHPVNPPYYVPLVEIVPTSWTDAEVISGTKNLMLEIGQAPVVLRKEVMGFALNRIQYAILNECWRLVSDGILDVKEVDVVMSEGLGMRYAFLGPLETAHLNAQGMAEYIDKYAAGIYKTSNDFGPIPNMATSEAKDQIISQLEAMVPTKDLDQRRRFRDRALRALSKIKNELASE